MSLEQLKVARYGIGYGHTVNPWPISDSLLECEYNCWYSMEKLLRMVSGSEQMNIKLYILHRALGISQPSSPNVERALQTKYAFWPPSEPIYQNEIVNYREFTGRGDIHHALNHAHLPPTRLVPRVVVECLRDRFGLQAEGIITPSDHTLEHYLTAFVNNMDYGFTLFHPPADLDVAKYLLKRPSPYIIFLPSSQYERLQPETESLHLQMIWQKGEHFFENNQTILDPAVSITNRTQIISPEDTYILSTEDIDYTSCLQL